MKTKTAALIAALLLMAYSGISTCMQESWNEDCAWFLCRETQVYTPGTEDEVCATLPAGTACRVEESVGDTWQVIEYMIGGRTYTGMVLADALGSK